MKNLLFLILVVAVLLAGCAAPVAVEAGDSVRINHPNGAVHNCVVGEESGVLYPPTGSESSSYKIDCRGTIPLWEGDVVTINSQEVGCGDEIAPNKPVCFKK